MAPGASRKKTCFVITPYGDPEGTDEQKEHAKVIDGLIENVLRPVERVCLEAGLAIQIANGTGLAPYLRKIERDGDAKAPVETRVAYVEKYLADTPQN